jgi:hypothetical protein
MQKINAHVIRKSANSMGKFIFVIYCEREKTAEKYFWEILVSVQFLR